MNYEIYSKKNNVTADQLDDMDYTSHATDTLNLTHSEIQVIRYEDNGHYEFDITFDTTDKWNYVIDKIPGTKKYCVIITSYDTGEYDEAELTAEQLLQLIMTASL